MLFGWPGSAAAAPRRLGVRCDRPEQGPSGNTYGQAVVARWAASLC
jgi:hypothetical protein